MSFVAQHVFALRELEREFVARRDVRGFTGAPQALRLLVARVACGDREADHDEPGEKMQMKSAPVRVIRRDSCSHARF